MTSRHATNPRVIRTGFLLSTCSLPGQDGGCAPCTPLDISIFTIRGLVKAALPDTRPFFRFALRLQPITNFPVPTVQRTGSTSVLDFNNNANTWLTTNSLSIDNGVTLTINQWMSGASKALSTVFTVNNTLEGGALVPRTNTPTPTFRRPARYTSPNTTPG